MTLVTVVTCDITHMRVSCDNMSLCIVQATFVLEVDAPSHLTVLANSPAASTRWIVSSAASSVARVSFQPTPPMSTYLLSVAVGELKAASATTNK